MIGPAARSSIKWASSLAHLKGLRLDNLTTSFADGKIFECILDEYEVYFLKGTESSKKQATAQQGWQSRLKALGCTSQFGKSEGNLEFSSEY